VHRCLHRPDPGRHLATGRPQPRHPRRPATTAAPPHRSPPILTWSRSSLVTCTNGLPTASAVPRRPCPYRPNQRGSASGGGK
jgi:hypothetical protein